MLNTLIDALNATGIAFKETGWSKAPGTDYGAVALDGSGASVWADDQMTEQAITGTVDLFTLDSGIAQMKSVQQALCDCKISWRLNTIQYEEDTGLTHYEWVFEMEAI